MKKLIACLFMSAMIFGLTACGQSPSDKVVQEGKGEVPEYKELTDPRGTTLESTATGESNPKMVDTIYETKDVVIADYVPTEMGYAIDPTGKTDSTVGIQTALYDCYENGGGTVFLPAGNYAISDTIYIPPYVSLRGDWNDPDGEDFNGDYGTIISVWMESEDKETAGAFKMGGSAGAVGLTIYYPLQTMECVMPYAYTFYVDGIGPNFMLATISNVTMINSYRGIGTPREKAHEMMRIDNVKGTFLHCGMSNNNSSDVDIIKNFKINNKYWIEASADCMNAVQESVIDEYTKLYTVGMELSDAEWSEYNNIFIDGCAIGIHTVTGERVAFSGSLYDVTITNCAEGIRMDDLSSSWGAVIAKSYVEGGISNYTEGKLKVCDVEIVGDVIEEEEGSIIFDEEADFSEYNIDYEDTYVKPTENVIIADIPNGLFTDAGPELQVALNQMATQGGGVVYVPGGTYRFETPITVPAGVELRGSSSVATREQTVVCNGTLFLCYYGDDASNGPEDQAFITLSGENAGLNGIRIMYPENSTKSENINSTYTVRGTASGVYVVNSMIGASAYGIDFRECDNHYIDGVSTTCYYNCIYVGGTGGTVTRFLQNGTVMVRTEAQGLENWVTGTDMFNTLTDPVLREECNAIKVENATNQLIYCSFAYGCKTFLENMNSENTILVNIAADNIGTTDPQLRMDGGSMIGINILRYGGYSYDLVAGDVALYNRLGLREVAEKTVIKSK